MRRMARSSCSALSISATKVMRAALGEGVDGQEVDVLVRDGVRDIGQDAPERSSASPPP